MNKVIIIATFLILLVVVARAEEVHTNPKLFQISKSGDVVVIEGKWGRVTGFPSVEVPRANSIRIECHRDIRMCFEHIAKLILPSDDSSGLVKQSHLFLMRQDFRVLEWSQTEIVAVANPTAADLGLKISLVDKTAMRTSQETAARGAKGANLSVIHLWRLE